MSVCIISSTRSPRPCRFLRFSQLTSELHSRRTRLPMGFEPSREASIHNSINPILLPIQITNTNFSSNLKGHSPSSSTPQHTQKFVRFSISHFSFIPLSRFLSINPPPLQSRPPMLVEARGRAPSCNDPTPLPSCRGAQTSTRKT